MSKINCKLVADLSVFSINEIFLVKYKDKNKYDHQKGWFLPDDLLMEFEHPVEAAKRILKEQLNLSEASIQLDHIESFQGNDRSWHLVFHYKTEIQNRKLISISEDIDSGEWFSLNNLPDKKEVAHHGWALYTISEILEKKKE